MNEEWAKAQLQQFVEFTALVGSYGNDGSYYGQKTVGQDANEIIPAAQVVEQIIDRVLPNWRDALRAGRSGLWREHHEAARRALVELERHAELADMLGDTTPTMNASSLHPWAWDAARSLWQSGHFREAVQAAAMKINAETQNKLGRRDISETKLFQQAFSSDNPNPQNPRLRPDGDDNGQTSLSLRRGVMSFAEGCFAGIRNPAAHDGGDLKEQDALEQLAAFSVLARWVDGARVASE
jgi:hypothetical protein